MKDNSKKYAVIVIVITFIVYIMLYFNNSNSRKNLQSHKSFTSGVVTEFHKSIKGGSSINYFYIVNGEKKNDSKGYGNINYRLGDTLVGKHFTVIYNNLKVESNDILITPEDFKEYNFTFPDSLNWINKILVTD